MRRGSVQQMRLGDAGQFDLIQSGIDRDGRKVALAYSEVTGEVYTYEPGEPDVLVEIYGWAETIEAARETAAVCAVEPTGLTLIESAARHLNEDRYRFR